MEIKIKKTDVPEKKIIEVSNSPKIFMYFDGEKYFSFSGICPHAKWPLELGRVSEEQLTCGGHSWEFDISNGKCTSNPGRDLQSYKIVENLDEITIVI